MQLVVEISEDTFFDLKKKQNRTEVDNAVFNSTPLPKGHGDIVDIGECNRKLFYQQCGGADSLITVETAFDMLMALPTIIEADKEADNGNEA